MRMFSAVQRLQPMCSCFLVHYITHCVKFNQTKPDSKQTKGINVWKSLQYYFIARSHVYLGISESLVLCCRCFVRVILFQFAIKWKSHKLFSVHLDAFYINMTSYKFGNVTHKNIQLGSERWNLFFKLKQWTCAFGLSLKRISEAFHRTQSSSSTSFQKSKPYSQYWFCKTEAWLLLSQLHGAEWQWCLYHWNTCLTLTETKVLLSPLWFVLVSVQLPVKETCFITGIDPHTSPRVPSAPLPHTAVRYQTPRWTSYQCGSVCDLLQGSEMT